ncbi:MAG TPA: TIGR00730 family Rossman fold protein [Longimicrobiaceae bacterium]|nr:TIGR00730 family Rossman fold protein [Longimicrobiaceae bacterium]
MRELKRVCVFCGSSAGVRPAYGALARRTGRLLAGRGIGLVYGGGRVGLMGALADAALEAGGEVIGVIPDALLAREVGHGGLTELRVVRSMHERKALMADLADAFVALPGGFGTWEEFFEVLTWSQLGIHPKPCGLLDVDGFYRPFLEMMDHAVAEGFVRPQHRALVLRAAEPGRMLELLAAWEAPPVPKWIGRDET